MASDDKLLTLPSVTFRITQTTVVEKEVHLDKADVDEILTLRRRSLSAEYSQLIYCLRDCLIRKTRRAQTPTTVEEYSLDVTWHPEEMYSLLESVLDLVPPAEEGGEA